MESTDFPVTAPGGGRGVAGGGVGGKGTLTLGDMGGQTRVPRPNPGSCLSGAAQGLREGCYIIKWLGKIGRAVILCDT